MLMWMKNSLKRELFTNCEGYHTLRARCQRSFGVCFRGAISYYRQFFSCCPLESFGHIPVLGLVWPPENFCASLLDILKVHLLKHYGRSYHQRVLSAVPPYARWPTDLKVPFTDIRCSAFLPNYQKHWQKRLQTENHTTTDRGAREAHA
eukprot:5305147-Amphidinium_carterae.1